ncbi:MAG: S41 family peptidase [Bacteroidales bacterium]
MKYAVIILMFCNILLAGCEKSLLTTEFSNTPLGNFETLWHEFDIGYGAMAAKSLNWDSLKQVYGSRVTNSSSDNELFGAMCGLLHEINDGHTDLKTSGGSFFRSWNRRDKSFYVDSYTRSMDDVRKHFITVRASYLNNIYTSVEVEGWMFFYGTVYVNQKKIGYINLPSFSLDHFPDSFIQSAVDDFQLLDAVIIDLRFNGGGNTESFVKTLNRFANEPQVFLKSKYRNGPSHNDFSEMFEHRIRPHADCLKNKPIAILMNSYTASSSEHFILGMKSQKGVFTVGDTTCGAFSSVNERLLPNGWCFRIGGQVVYTPEGSLLVDSKGRYLEGIGLTPDFYVPDHWGPLVMHKDLPLDKAIEKLTLN